MGFSRNKMTSILILSITFISSAAIFTYGNSTINQVIIIIQLFLLLGLAMFNNIFLDRVVLIILFLNLASIIITMAYHKSFGVSLVFLNILLSCIVFNNINVNKSTFLCSHLISALIWSLWILFSVKGVYNPEKGSYLWYKFLDSIYHKNTMGIVAIGCIYHWTCVLETISIRRISKNIFFIIIGIPYVYKIIESECRSAIFALIIFAILYYLIRHEIPYRMYYVILIVCIILSGIFTLFYVGNIVELDFGDVMGRNTVNRLDVWKDAVSLIREYPFFGSGTDYKMYITDSAHNTVLSILKTIGVVPLLSYVFCFGKRLSTQKFNSYCRVSQIVVLSGMMISVFESFYTESYFSIVFLLFLINPEFREYVNYIHRDETR